MQVEIAARMDEALTARTSYSGGTLSIDADCWFNGPIAWTMYAYGSAEHDVASGGAWVSSPANITLDMRLAYERNDGTGITKDEVQNNLSFGSSADSAALSVDASVVATSTTDSVTCTW